MLYFTKTVSCLALRTAWQIDTKLMHNCEIFRQNLFVKFHFMEDLDFLIHEVNEVEKNFSPGFVLVQNIRSFKPCHVLLKHQQKMSLISDKKIVGLRHMTS